jgi:hypothetical protein
VTGHAAVMAVTQDDEVRAFGSSDADSAREQVERDGADDAMRTVIEIAEWVPEAYRQAYLDGLAAVLGSAPTVRR